MLEKTFSKLNEDTPINFRDFAENRTALLSIYRILSATVAAQKGVLFA
jgi:hypothetical protein